MDLALAAVVKAGNLFAVSERDAGLPGGPFGIYLDDCRHVSAHALQVDGRAPVLREASDAGGHVSEHVFDGARLAREITGPATVVERLTLDAPAAVTLRVGADFLHMLTVRAWMPPPDTAVEREAVPGGIRFARTGADGVRRSTTVTCDPPATTGDDGVLRVPETAALTTTYALDPGGPVPVAPAPPPAPELQVDDARVGRLLARALADVDVLRSSLDGRAYPAAGVPWYVTLFGRDSLITSTQLLAFDPDMAAGTLRLLVALLGATDDPRREEAPGKVLHELRVGEAVGRSPLARYYGTVDATPLLLCLLADHADWTGDAGLFEELRDGVDAALAWLDRHPDGLLAYARGTPEGLVNQGWKDSPDGIPGPDGRPLTPPVTLVEPQAYAIRGRLGVARLFEHTGDAARATQLRADAAAHGERLERFWLAGRRCYALGWGADGRVSPVAASNQGHLLWAAELSRERARAVRDAVMGPALFSGWGIRTLAEGDPGYDPLSYHRGSVWPHDTAMTAWGLRRHGFDADFQRVLDALMDAAAGMADARLPELFSGAARERGHGPETYGAACRPQAWAAGALPSLVVAGLGLRPDGLHGRLAIERPLLPAGVDRLALRGLRVAGATVDLSFARGADGDVAVQDAAVDGALELVTAP